MHYTSIFPYFLIMGLILILATMISRLPFFSNILIEEEISKLSNLDGLRGFLALGVFFHHSVIMYFYYITGEWKIPPSSFYTLLGEASVVLFFMITGFLFWLKVLKSKFEIKHFFIRRIQRIVPLYIFTTSIVIFLVFFVTNFTLQVSLPELFIQILRWFSFTFLGTPDINGYKNTYTIESVYWTLKWEWLFYLSLPLLVLLRHIVNSNLIVLIALLFGVYFNFNFSNIHIFNFSLGMLAAAIFYQVNLKGSYQVFLDVSAILNIILIFILFSRGYGIGQSIVLFLFFVFIMLGSTIFGLLQLSAARTLGIMSYSIYLLHNIILWIVYRISENYLPIVDFSPLQFWALVCISAVIVVWLSSQTYRYIEHYFYFTNFKIFYSRSN